ncbi:hypothetical protein AQ611_12310 [Burkholderia singularis]|nr:hypothetical protein AQ611_12310 [Burkholderia sp. Bp7605]
MLIRLPYDQGNPAYHRNACRSRCAAATRGPAGRARGPDVTGLWRRIHDPQWVQSSIGGLLEAEGFHRRLCANAAAQAWLNRMRAPDTRI